MKKTFAIILCTIAIALTSCAPAPAQTLTNEEFEKIAMDAYTFAYPLVLMEQTLRASTNVEAVSSRGAPINQFGHAKALADADFKTVVMPNVDTLYSQLYFDLSAEPVVLQKPATDRYCSFQVLDAYSNVRHILGTGGLDNGAAATYVLTGPTFSGSVPAGTTEIKMPTNNGLVLVRTICYGPDDLENIFAVQEGIVAYPLSSYQKEYTPAKGVPDPKYDVVPDKSVAGMDVDTFFNQFNNFSQNNPPTKEDEPAMKTFEKIGVGAGLKFDSKRFDEEKQQILAELPAKMRTLYQTTPTKGQDVNGWSYSPDNIGIFGTDYFFRAQVALSAFLANPIEMAIYPMLIHDSGNTQPTSDKDYVIHFEKGELPKVKDGGFWSITAYTEEGYLVPNELDKYSISDRTELAFNDDGSCDILVSKTKPDNTSNWLPVADGNIRLTMRIYLPADAVMSKEWKPPFLTLAQ